MTRNIAFNNISKIWMQLLIKAFKKLDTYKIFIDRTVGQKFIGIFYHRRREKFYKTFLNYGHTIDASNT